MVVHAPEGTETMEITTTARRITRALNAERPGFRLMFDADGRVLYRLYDPERRTELVLGDEEKARIKHTFTRGRERWTYREVQAAITPPTPEEERRMAEVWQEMQDEADAWYAEVAR